jgi:hypothetical protein
MADSSGQRDDDRPDKQEDDDSRWEWETDPEGDGEREVVGEASFKAEGWEEMPADPEEASRLLRALEGVMPDVLKRTLSAGVEGLASGEERIRATLSEGELPREALGMLMRYADLTKRELLRLISREIRHFLEDMDFGGEIAKILTSLSLEARMQVRFIPNEDAVKPNASGSLKVSQSGTKDDAGGAAEGEAADKEGDEEPTEGNVKEGRWTDRWREQWDRATEAVDADGEGPWEKFRRRRDSANE